MARARKTLRIAEQLYDELYEIVQAGADKEPCDADTLVRYNALARTVVPHDLLDKYIFNPHVQFADSKQCYANVLDRTWKLCAISQQQMAALDGDTGDDEVGGSVIENRRGMRRLVFPFLTTISAAGIAFFVAAHIAAVAPDTIRWIFGH